MDTVQTPPPLPVAVTPTPPSPMRGIGMNHSTWQVPDQVTPSADSTSTAAQHLSVADATARTPTRTARKVIFFIRHGQAAHNVPPLATTSQLLDPRLTAEGVRQAQRLLDHLPADAVANLPLIVCSPLRRALQTCQHAFGRMIEWRGVRLLLAADFEENRRPLDEAPDGLPCDRGVAVQQLRDEFPAFVEEIGALPREWHLARQERGLPACNSGDVSPLAAAVDATTVGTTASTASSVEERYAEQLAEKRERARHLLLAQPDTLMVVISHNGFLRTLLGDALWSMGGRTPHGFDNGEIRRVVMTADGQFLGGAEGGGGGGDAAIRTISATYNDELEAVGGIGQ